MHDDAHVETRSPIDRGTLARGRTRRSVHVTAEKRLGSLDPLPNRPTSEVFGTDQLVVYARAVCWVTRGDDGALKLGRVETYPSWTPFESRDVFRFKKPPS